MNTIQTTWCLVQLVFCCCMCPPATQTRLEDLGAIYHSQRGVACETNVLHVWIQFHALCARNAHITVYDVTTWSWVNLVNPAPAQLSVACSTEKPSLASPTHFRKRREGSGELRIQACPNGMQLAGWRTQISNNALLNYLLRSKHAPWEV